MQLICYDISSNKLRTKLDKLLSDYGIRVQYSIFKIDQTQTRYKALLSKIDILMECHPSLATEGDSVLCIDIGDGQQLKTLVGQEIAPERFTII